MAGVKLPLYYVSQNQINAIVPFAIKPNAPQYLLVQRGLTYSVPVLMNVAPAQPEIFSMITSLPASGGTPFVVSDSAPATVGDTLVLYCTGLGTVTPKIGDGSAPGDASSVTDAPVQVLMGGQQASVIYAGLAPGFAGLYQVNAVVPAGVPPGDAIQISLTAAGQTSPAVRIAVK